MLKQYFLHILAILALCAVVTLDCNYKQLQTAPIQLVNIDPPQLKISFSGDLMLHKPQIEAAKTDINQFSFDHYFSSLSTMWQSVDFAVLNFETTISPNSRYSGYPRFSSPRQIAKSIHDAGISVVALANNHICDNGFAGIQETISTFDSLGIITTGAYRDSLAASKITYLQEKGYKVALLNYTYGTNGIPIPKNTFVNTIDTMLITRHIAQSKCDSATHIIAFFHWGNEYERVANKKQTKIAAWCRSQGIDVVIGSHPHVVQNIDTTLRVIYSLGNLVSNQQDRYTDSGISAIITLDFVKAPKIDYLPHWVDKIASKHDKYQILLESDSTKIDYKANLFRALNHAREAANGI